METVEEIIITSNKDRCMTGQYDWSERERESKMNSVCACGRGGGGVGVRGVIGHYMVGLQLVQQTVLGVEEVQAHLLATLLRFHSPPLCLCNTQNNRTIMSVKNNHILQQQQQHSTTPQCLINLYTNIYMSHVKKATKKDS